MYIFFLSVSAFIMTTLAVKATIDLILEIKGEKEE